MSNPTAEKQVCHAAACYEHCGKPATHVLKTVGGGKYPRCADHAKGYRKNKRYKVVKL